MSFSKSVLALALALPLFAFAAPPASSPAGDSPLLRLDASASQNLVDDTAWALLVVERDAKESAAAQKKVATDMNAVVAAAKKVSGLELRSGSTFGFPVYGKDGQISGWKSRAELRIESKTSADVARLAADVASLARLNGSGFYLSQDSRTAAEKGLIAAAIKEFQGKAKTAAEALGYREVVLQEVSIGQVGGAMAPMPMMTMKASRAEMLDVPALSMEPGKTTVTVTVGGAVQLR